MKNIIFQQRRSCEYIFRNQLNDCKHNRLSEYSCWSEFARNKHWLTISQRQIRRRTGIIWNRSMQLHRLMQYTAEMLIRTDLSIWRIYSKFIITVRILLQVKYQLTWKVIMLQIWQMQWSLIIIQAILFL